MNEVQANTSYRELAMNTKARLSKIGASSPNLNVLWGLKVDPRTTFYYATEARLRKHVSALVADGYDESKFKIKRPKV